MLTCGILVGSVYWSLTTHGALTIMQVSISLYQSLILNAYFQILGYKDGLNVIQETNPIFLLASLPIIPFILVLGRMIKWDEALLKFWRKHSGKVPDD
jgi:E3 ubiquitin-protein ligase MARCH5